MDRRILIVDDEEGILDMLHRVLSNQPYQIEVAKNGSEAIEKISSEFYDVVVTDLRMPGKLSGKEVLKSIKNSSPKTEVMIITGYATIENAVELMKLGAYDYIVKPFHLKEIEAKVERIFDFKELLNKAENKNNAENNTNFSTLDTIKKLELLLAERELQIEKINKYVNVLLLDLEEDSSSYKLVKRIHHELKKVTKY